LVSGKIAMKYELIHSEPIYQGKAFNVQRDLVRLPDGNTSQLDVVKHVGAVTLVPCDEQERIWFVRQYRHPAGEMLLELPAGTLKVGEPPEICAARELREEIGHAAHNLRKLGEFFLAPGYSSEFMHVFLATDLYAAPLPQDDDEFIKTEAIPLSTVFAMAAQGQLRDGKTLAALFLAREHLLP